MPFTGNENPVLLAPRPVRLNTLLTRSRVTSGPDHQERVRFADENDADGRTYESSDKEISSQRSSPARSPLPTEALEEFLSILRPSFFPPSFSRYCSLADKAPSPIPTFQHERSYSFKGRALLQQKNEVVDELEVSRSTQPSRNTHTPDASTEDDRESEGETLPSAGSPRTFFVSTLTLLSLIFTQHVDSDSASPISRWHTRNPFHRHSSYAVSPGPISPISLSPSAIPLPLSPFPRRNVLDLPSVTPIPNHHPLSLHVCMLILLVCLFPIHVSNLHHRCLGTYPSYSYIFIQYTPRP
ncbi:hypothetical protein C8J57DRAFT_1063871 [Mycena rebaudengoi]|nr:hypothetical protein C8J57DRAFT_1063871 [Mycena rebaudengoi]